MGASIHMELGIRSRMVRRLAVSTAAALLCTAPIRALDSENPGDRISLGAPKPTPRSGMERGLRERVRELLAPSGDPRGLAPLLIAATLYGIVHALGPGHQKTLLGGYFLGGEGSLGKAALAAAGTAALHAFSVLLIFGGFAAASRSIRDAERARLLLTRGAGYALLALAVLITFRRIRAAAARLGLYPTKRGRTTPPLDSDQDIRHTREHEHGHAHADGSSCAVCERMERRRAAGGSFWAVLLAGGLVPCPGAAFMLLLGVSAGNPGAGILAVLAISLGMAVTLFAVAAGARAARAAVLVLGASAENRRIRDIAVSALDIGGAVLMVGFAAVLVL